MKALLLIGSSKPAHSTSESLGSFVCECLHERGVETEARTLWKSLKSNQDIASLLQATKDADLVILTFPLFADSLPAPAIKALELIAEYRRAQPGLKPQRLMAIANNGFPEASQNNLAIEMCRQFAHQAGFEWAGGLTVGGGGTISGVPLSQIKNRAGRLMQALDCAAGALAQGNPVPPEVVSAVARPMIPPWMYSGIAWIGWQLEARKTQVSSHLRDRPYDAL